jgi:hypothetical protein
VIDAAFVLANIEFTEHAGEEQRDEITLILEQYFKVCDVCECCD